MTPNLRVSGSEIKSEASDVLTERFKRELFWPAHRVSSGFELFSFVGPGNKAGKKDTYFSGIEHEMYVTAGPYLFRNLLKPLKKFLLNLGLDIKPKRNI